MTLWTTMKECGREPFFLDWTSFYDRHGLDPAGDLITSSEWVVTGGAKGTEFLNTPETGVFISGGTPGGVITAKNIIQINGGVYQDCRTITIGVQ